MFAVSSRFAVRCICLIPAIVLGSLATLATVRSHAEEPPEKIEWRKNYAQAVRDAEKLKRPLLVEVTAPWCVHCRHMTEQTFSDSQIVRRLNQSFVPLRVDIDVERKLARALGADALPATIIISPDLRIIARVTGFRAPAAFAGDLDPIIRSEGHIDETTIIAQKVPAPSEIP